MIYLNFMRHAKTDCSSYNGNDFNKPVSRNGILQTEAVKKFLKTKNISYDFYFCSPSTRTKQTLEYLLNNESVKKRHIVEDFNLYEGDNDNFLLRLSKVKGFKNILVITHEPQISYFIDFFLSENNHSGKISQIQIVTSSIISIKFNVDRWNLISNHNAEFFQFIDPNKLFK